MEYQSPNFRLTFKIYILSFNSIKVYFLLIHLEPCGFTGGSAYCSQKSRLTEKPTSQVMLVTMPEGKQNSEGFVVNYMLQLGSLTNWPELVTWLCLMSSEQKSTIFPFKNEVKGWGLRIGIFMNST